MDKGSFSCTKLVSKSGKALGTRLTFAKIKNILTDQPYLQTQGRVMANKQFFKSSLSKHINKDLKLAITWAKQEETKISSF